MKIDIVISRGNENYPLTQKLIISMGYCSALENIKVYIQGYIIINQMFWVLTSRDL